MTSFISHACVIFSSTQVNFPDLPLLYPVVGTPDVNYPRSSYFWLAIRFYEVVHNHKRSLMKRVFSKVWQVAKKGSVNFIDGDSFTYAASIAFYTIFSLPAVLMIAISIGATFYEENYVQEELIGQVSALIGSQSARGIERILMNVSYDEESGYYARIAGIITLLISATTVFISLQLSLNRVWNVRPKPKRGRVKYLINRLLSLAMVISVGFILLVSLVAEAVLAILHDFMAAYFGWASVYVAGILSTVATLLIISSIFGLIFKILPDAKIRWKDVWIGALVTGFLFSTGKYLIGLYLGASSITNAYGTAGSLVIILVWVYYSSVLFLFGANLIYAYTEIFNRAITPYSNAVRVKTIEIETEEDGSKRKVEKKKG